MAYIALDHVEKLYHVGEVTITAVSDISFTVDKGEFVVVVGPSGAGKTTVLNILGGMDRCTSGTITVDGQTISSYGPKELTVYRRFDIGFVFQFYNLVQNLTALETWSWPPRSPSPPSRRQEVLAHAGPVPPAAQFPASFPPGGAGSGWPLPGPGQEPKLLLCDEPTGALDYVTGKAILKLLQDTCRQQGMTVIVITHNTAIAPMADKVIPREKWTGGADRLEPQPLASGRD